MAEPMQNLSQESVDDIDEGTKMLLKSGNYYVQNFEVMHSQGKPHLNFYPILLNLFLPWIGFVVMLTLTIFRWRHDHLILNELLWWTLIVGVIILYTRRIFKEMTWAEARWTRASFFLVVFNICACLIAQFFLYNHYFAPYYQLKDLKTYTLIDVTTTSGKNILDAGTVYFTQGTQINLAGAWHFKQDDNYCIAPLINRDINGNIVPTATGSTDFFVVGKNCCSSSSSDYRCPGYNNPSANAGLRIVNTDDLSFYKLAVKQGETRHNYMSAYPIFFEWVEDPIFQIEDRKDDGMALYYTTMGASFGWQLILVGFFVWKFSNLGRKKT